MIQGERILLAGAAADALPIGIWLVDREGSTLYRNPRFAVLAPGVNSLADLARCLPGVPITTYAGRVQSGEVSTVVGGGAARRTVDEPSALLRPPHAEARLVQLRMAPGPEAHSGSLLIVLEDVSERLRIERLRALAETSIALCHEINNPLAVLAGEIDLLDRAGRLPARQLGSIRAAVARIASVLRRLRLVNEPLSADYLPSRGVRMLDLAPEPDGAQPARRRGRPAQAPGGRETAA